MVGDVLEALAAVPGLDAVIVVTAEPLAAAAARRAGADLIDDPEEAGQSAAAARGVSAAIDRGAERALLVPGDCPALDPEEIEALIGGTARQEVAIVPDRHGKGTNALLLAPPDAIAPAFGPASLARHESRAVAAGVEVRVVAVPSLLLDVDTPGDLAALRSALDARPQCAPRTRALLERLTAAAA
jgi:2-phospho-L-lactate/phosphoenolpyruvate guanylyltransferase